MEGDFKFFPQWNIQQTKYKLAVKCKLAKLTSDPWETLDDFSNLYKGSLTMPYVSCMVYISKILITTASKYILLLKILV